MFKRQWFEGKIRRMAPPGTRWVRHWDLAATRKITAARTAGVKLGIAPDRTYWVGHVVLTQDEGNEVRKLIKATAEVDGPGVEISLPQDPGQAGKVQARDMVAMLAPFIARSAQETGDKATRAEPFSVQCEAGNVFLVEGPWVEPYIDELCMFPAGTFADQVDASSGAFGRLARPSTFVGIAGPRLHD
jgi:predicted phage terminase large subunit-like protein